MNTFADIERLEADLWEAADNLRANSRLSSSESFMPVLGLIFLRHATNRFEAATRQLEAEQARGATPRRRLRAADYTRRRALWLPKAARYDELAERATTRGRELPALVTAAMNAIEAAHAPLAGVLPKNYDVFEAPVLADLLRVFNREAIRRATGDVFGRIYEYFLARFSAQRAHDNGEFFTPPSLVQMIVQVIEPERGVVLDPACGSAGMFVQTGHFIERSGRDPAKSVVFYGLEKNRETVRLARMNLAVHGLTGTIAEAITYYEDPHALVGQCDFVMANPPFNVDLVDAARVVDDPRLPFGVPGINKSRRVGNANFLWISYIWSYLEETGRAGFVMSSQASSAGRGEREVRRKLVETGDVDVMIAIRSNFFYTRTVPCELWFFDRGKPAPRRDAVLMIDARAVFRRVNRALCEFSREQAKNLGAIVWLYRGQRARFLELIASYFEAVAEALEPIPPALAAFEVALAAFEAARDAFCERVAQTMPAGRSGVSDERTTRARAAATELAERRRVYVDERAAVVDTLGAQAAALRDAPRDNEGQHAARARFAVAALAVTRLSGQVTSVYELAARSATRSLERAPGSSARERRALDKLVKQLDAARRRATASLERALYFHRQIEWLHERFPDAALVDVPGLVKLTPRADIEAADWSLSPGRHVGVAPPSDGDVDFTRALRELRGELAELNREAAALATRIDAGLEELGL